VDYASAGRLEPVGEVPVPEYNPQSKEKIELGKTLFWDTRLSGDGSMGCVTCHDPKLGFSDGLDMSFSYPTTKNWRNSPTLINVGFNRYLFHDGRALSLEEQALFSIMSSFLMNQNLDFVEEEIREVPEYVDAFMKVFGGDVNRERIAMALASFQRTLVSRNSALDRHLMGEKRALSRNAKKGLEIFTGKGGCAECHYGPNLSDGSFHAIGVPENPRLLDDPGIAVTRRFVAKLAGYDDYKNLKEDPGRYLVTRDMKDWKAFKTPTLRDVARTAPYMHNGVFKTIEEVLDFFDMGGSGPLKPLGLSEREKKYLKAFLLEALTGEEIVMEAPEMPPVVR
jgi:cytochrome c peroxidase